MKYIYGKAAWRGDSTVNTTHTMPPAPSPETQILYSWGETDLVTSLTTVSSSLILRYKLMKSRFLFLNPLLAALLKGNMYPFLTCVTCSAAEISPHLHPITIQFSRFFSLLLCSLFYEHSSISFVGYSSSTIAPYVLILSHFLNFPNILFHANFIHPNSVKFLPL